MSGINWSRVQLGGLAAGVVMNVFDALVNGMMLGPMWEAETNALNSGLMARVATTSMVGWIVFDFCMGIALVWIYASIRPRYGPGFATALRAGFAVWAISHLAFASLAFMGLYSSTLVLYSTLGGMASAIAGAYVGGMLYREEGAAVGARVAV